MKYGSSKQRLVGKMQPNSRCRSLLYTFGALLLAAGGADGAERGSAGLAPLAVVVANDAGTEIACAAAVAHWYSVDLGAAPAGGTVRMALWRDAATGAVFALNAVGDRLPIERLWCGLAGRTWATRTEIALPKHAGATADVSIACTGGERLDCR